MKVIKILGAGCGKCNVLEAKVKDLISSNGLEVKVEKVTDINKMMEYCIMMTPAIVVDEKVRSTGIIPEDEQILAWIKGE